jgi:hypothetical protein
MVHQVVDMRWLKKREVVVYLELRRRFNYAPFNLGDAISHMRPYMPPKVLISTVKYLVKVGLVTSLGDFNYKLNDFDDYLLSEVVYPYLRRRFNLRRRSLR